MNDERNYVESIVAHTAAPRVEEIGADRQGLLLPAGWNLIDLEKFYISPCRQSGSLRADTADAFVALVKIGGTDGTPRIYTTAKWPESVLAMTAVLNDYDSANTAWRDHRIHFDPALSVEWSRWNSHNKSVMSQEKFATFLEDNINDVVSGEGLPSGAQLLQMALDLELRQDYKVRSAVRLQGGGSTLEFVRGDDNATVEKMRAFDRFRIGIPVFRGDELRYPIEARLRYRVKDASITFWYELSRPDVVFEFAGKALVSSIETLTGMRAIYGAP